MKKKKKTKSVEELLGFNSLSKANKAADYSEIHNRLMQLGPEPIEAFQTEEKVNVGFLDDLYHTESVPVFRLKLACYGVALSTEDIAWLCENTTYHAAFWPHTKPRFQMLKRYLRLDSDAGKRFSSCKFRTMLKMQISWMVKQMQIDKLHDTPGRRDELANYRQLLKLAESIYTKRSMKR